MARFDRKCIVSIGPPGQAGVELDERFRIAFRIVKTLTSDTNVTDCQAWGLGSDLRQQVLEPGQILQIEAGYASGTEVLSVADITRTRIRRDPPDIITDLECLDGATELRQRKVAVSFAPGTPVQRVLDKLAQELALGERATGVQVQGEYLQGVTLSTSIRDALDRVTRKAGVTWSIQDRELQILERDQSSQGQGVLLTPATGLLTSPEELEDPEAESQRLAGFGYRVRSLLNPKIRPGESLVIESADVQGQYRIDRVEHVGDTRGTDWYSEADVYAE